MFLINKLKILTLTFTISARQEFAVSSDDVTAIVQLGTENRRNTSETLCYNHVGDLFYFGKMWQTIAEKNNDTVGIWNLK